MHKIAVSIFIAVLLLFLAAEALAQEQALAPEQAQPKALRVGFEKTKPLNNLDVYGSKPTYDIEAFANIKPAFNVSQRSGTAAKLTYNTSIFKPIYNVSAYSNLRPMYEVPSSVHSKPVYDIGSYPTIKAVNSIP